MQRPNQARSSHGGRKSIGEFAIHDWILLTDYSTGKLGGWKSTWARVASKPAQVGNSTTWRVMVEADGVEVMREVTGQMRYEWKGEG